MPVLMSFTFLLNLKCYFLDWANPLQTETRECAASSIFWWKQGWLLSLTILPLLPRQDVQVHATVFFFHVGNSKLSISCDYYIIHRNYFTKYLKHSNLSWSSFTPSIQVETMGLIRIQIEHGKLTTEHLSKKVIYFSNPISVLTGSIFW